MIEITLVHYLFLSAIIFTLGVFGIFVNRKIFTLFILTVAAAESAIGLAILVVFFRNKGSIQVEDINSMKG